LRPLGVERGLLLPGRNHQRRGVLGLRGHDVAERRNLRAGGEQIAKQRRAAPAGADQGHARFSFLKSHVHHAAMYGRLRGLREPGSAHAHRARRAQLHQATPRPDFGFRKQIVRVHDLSIPQMRRKILFRYIQ
jgi:hypothetical protein